MRRRHAPVRLRAGPFELEFQDGDLRGVDLDGRQVIQRVYVAVRDRDWGTVPHRLSRVRTLKGSDRFTISFDAVSRAGDVDFRWHARIEGAADGRLVYAVEGSAARDFLRNRIGLCVLHPATCAGSPCRWSDRDGREGRGSFPVDVVPHQPFTGIASFSHEIAGGTWARLDFEGETFEMEDQRNWTDGSFKIYGTPLSLPFPVPVCRGERVAQRVTLSLAGPAPIGRPPTPPARQGEPVARIEVGGPSGARLCRVGFGLAASGASDRWPSTVPEGLEPDHLRIECDVDRDDWESTLPRALEAARLAGRPCWGLLLTSAAELPDGVPRRFREAGVQPAAILVTRNAPPWNTDERLALSARTGFAAEGLRPLIGGGTDAHFAELNRTRPPVDALDLVFFAAHPQVHATDERSIIENLAGLAPAVRTAVGFSAGLPVCISPLTLGPRGRMRVHDAREATRFGTAWVLAAIRRVSEAGAGAVTFSDLAALDAAGTGERARPLGNVFHRLTAWAGAELLEASCGDPSIEVAALRVGGRIRVLAANLAPVPRTIIVEGARCRLAPYGITMG